MNYESIASIYAANETVRRDLFARVENLSDAQQTFRPEENAWSVAEIMEHLSILEQNMVQLIGMLLAKTEAARTAAAAAVGDAGEPASAAPSRSFQPFSLDGFVELIKDKKLTAPERVRPSGKVTLADSLARMQETRAALDSLRPRLEAADLTAAATYPHPAFGDFNLPQWLAFIGHHESRHLRQIEGLLAAPEFKSKNES